jgi:DNA-binding Lrp family transcriptional regulator
MTIDATDRVILETLQVEGRISNNELADRVGLSPSAALRRVRRLESAGIIASYVALLDPATIGRGTTVFVEISLSSQEESVLNRFEAAVVESPAVIACHLMAGDADYIVQVACADVADYERVHRTHLALLPGVARIKSSFSLRTVANRTAFDLP